MHRLCAFFVIPSTEILFQPNVEAYEEIAAAHLFEGKFGNAGTAVSPGYRDNRPAISANDGLQWKFDSQIKMGREQRTTTFNYGGTIGLESIGGVIQLDSKHQANKKIGHPV